MRRSRRLPPPRKAITIGQQVAKMQRDFPSFDYGRRKNLPTWYGTLQPTQDAPTYTVKIVYRFAGWHSKPPRVWVMSPGIHSEAPHRYSDESLCLYFPPERNWMPCEFISETIVPWTALWLAFYEIWLDTNRWYGPEAPHTGTKQKR
jgi:hypothetical protein